VNVKSIKQKNANAINIAKLLAINKKTSPNIEAKEAKKANFPEKRLLIVEVKFLELIKCRLHKTTLFSYVMRLLP